MLDGRRVRIWILCGWSVLQLSLWWWSHGLPSLQCCSRRHAQRNLHAAGRGGRRRGDVPALGGSLRCGRNLHLDIDGMSFERIRGEHHHVSTIRGSMRRR